VSKDGGKKMFNKASLGFFTLILIISGCGGPSGVDSSKYADELSADEKASLCDWTAQEAGNGKEFDCGDNVTATGATKEECIAAPAAHCLVSDVEACTEATMGNPCGILTNSECTALIACATGG
jgi:hypothetical protein